MRISDWSSDVCSSDLKVASCLPLDLTEVLSGPCDITHVEMVAAEDYRLGRRSSPSEVVRRIGDGFHDGNGIGVAALPPQRSEEHTSELQSLMRISYAVFCLKKKNNHQNTSTLTITAANKNKST